MFHVKHSKPLMERHEKSNLAVFSCHHVIDKKQPVLFVFHDADCDWQFLCGTYDHGDSDVRIVAFSEIIEIDPTVSAVTHIPPGCFGTRSSLNDSWEVKVDGN